MKTKAFFLVCLFLGFGLMQVTAQNGNDATRSVVYYFPHADFYTDIWCDGVFIDWIVGEGTGHVVDHYRNNLLQWTDFHYSGTATGLHGDIYEFSEIDKFNLPKQDVWTCHTHLKADNKAIYNLDLIINMSDWTVIVKQASCTGNMK